MPGCDAWDVVKVPFPYTNRTVRQNRPALVVGVKDATGTPRLLWVLMITSAENRGWPDDVPVTDLAAAGLPAPSIVRTAKIATIDIADATRIGTLPDRDRDEVAKRLRANLHHAINRR